MRNPGVKPAFASEADLCAAFVAWAKAHGWTPYAETASWDVLLVSGDGMQIGVQAKMRFNLKVLRQTLPDRWYFEWKTEGPDFRAILLPARDFDAEFLCGALGIGCFYAMEDYPRPHTFGPDLARDRRDAWHWWSPEQRCELPEYVPDVAAGASGPVQLTKWKIAALKVCALLELRGVVRREDFKRIGIDPRRWIGPDGWLDPTDTPGTYKRGAALNFDQQHPTVYQQVLADVRATWKELLV